MSLPINKYHHKLAEYFKIKPLYLVNKNKENPNVRKLFELPYQQTEGEMSEIEETLCDLMFIEAKCRAKMAYDLLVDYNRIGVMRARLGPPILTAKFWNSKYGAECPNCLAWSCVEEKNLGRLTECEECGSKLMLNPFYLEVEWKVCKSQKKVTKNFRNWHFKQSKQLDFYSEFIHVQCHILSIRPDLVLQMAANQPDLSPVAQAAIVHLNREGKEWLRWVNKLQKVSPVLMTLQGHSGAVNACEYSPDGKRIVSGSNDNTIKIWDADTGIEITSICAHSSAIKTCIYSPDGRRIVSGAEDYTLKIWDANIGMEITTIEAHSSVVTTCAFSSDGSRIVSGSWDKSLKIWDVKTDNKLAILRGHSKWVTSCGYSPDAKKIVSGSEDNTLRIWDSESGKEIAKLEGHTGIVTICAYSPDGKSIISGSEDSTLRIWNAETGEQIAKYSGQGQILSCSFSPDGKSIVAGLNDGTLNIIDVERGEHIVSHKYHSSAVLSCSYSPDGRRIISCSKDKTIKIWDASIIRNGTSIEGHSSSVNCCSYSPDGKRIISGSEDKTLKIWEASTGEEFALLEGNNFGIKNCAYSPDGKKIYSELYNNILKTWDAMNGKEISTFKYAFRSHHELINTDDGKIIVSPIKGEPQLKIWDTISGKDISSLEEYHSFLSKCSYSPDKRKNVFFIRIDNIKISDMIALFNAKNYANFSNKKRIISISDDKTIRLSDPESDLEITSFPCDTSIKCVSVNVGRQDFTVGCNNGSLMIFEIASVTTYSSEPMEV
jgi:WD40 repeat protein